jgi:hypothetical protein
MTFTPRRIFRAQIRYILHPITKSALLQVSCSLGVVETVNVFQGDPRVVAFVKYSSDHDVV